jgi:hypothetical protein
MIDPGGSEVAALRRSYVQHPSGAYYPERDLIRGEELLLAIGWLRQIGTRIVADQHLMRIAGEQDEDAITAIFGATLAATGLEPAQLESTLDELVPDAERREELLLALGAIHDDTRRKLVGLIGETIVVEGLKAELEGLGYPDRAAEVRHASLESDALGYDVTAPRIVGNRRLVEVKSTVQGEGTRFFISRNEVEIGQRFSNDWFLVFCQIQDIDHGIGQVTGWCRVDAIEKHLPSDRGTGKWQSASVELADGSVSPGLPPVV